MKLVRSVPVLTGNHLVEVVHAAAHEQPLAVVDVVGDIKRTVAVPLEVTTMIEREQFQHRTVSHHIGNLVTLISFAQGPNSRLVINRLQTVNGLLHSSA